MNIIFKCSHKNDGRMALCITGGAGNYCHRYGEYIEIVSLGRIEIDGEKFWKLEYTVDGLSYEIVHSEPLTYSTRPTNSDGR